jgi:hypothetical protein
MKPHINEEDFKRGDSLCCRPVGDLTRLLVGAALRTTGSGPCAAVLTCVRHVEKP